jgi:hypothetical protein
MTKSFVARAVLLVALLGACAGHGERLATGDTSPRSFAFALMGDLGYRPEQEPWLENVLTDMKTSSTPLAFVGHVGDLGHPRFGSCTNELWARRYAQFQALPHPLIYTPGDNEWTDCHEKGGAPGYDPLERLARLRTVFFASEGSLGQRTLALTRQSQTSDPVRAKYRENARWTYGGITFVTLHVVGSNNGRGRTPEGDAEYAERNAANLAWLREGFAAARTSRSRAIMIIQQANIFHEFPPIPSELAAQQNGFTDLRALLEHETIAFGKPVVLVHGDSHFFRVDKPLGAGGATPAVENFTRVETFGQPNHHWLQVTVEVDEPQVFTFRPRIVAANVIKR